MKRGSSTVILKSGTMLYCDTEDAKKISASLMHGQLESGGGLAFDVVVATNGKRARAHVVSTEIAAIIVSEA
jgi:hypothetical protein